MAYEKSLAIVLRLVEYSESSYIVTLLTEDFGKMAALAKGARRRKSAFESALDLLSISRIVFIPKSSDSLDLLTEAVLEKPFRSAKRELSRFYAGLYVAELTNSLTQNRDPTSDMFRKVRATLDALDGNGDVSTSLLRFEMQVLHDMGNIPSLDRCVDCGAHSEDSHRITFALQSGGVVCNRCKTGKRQIISMSRNAITAMKLLIDNDAKLVEYKQELNSFGEVRAVMNRYICHTLGNRPRLYDFLGFA